MDNKRITNLPFFFIIGRPRSGTTLLRTLLDAHPHVVIPQESLVILNLYGKYGKKTSWKEKDIQNFYNDLKNQHLFGIWNIDESQLVKSLLNCQGENTYQNLIKVLYSNFHSVYEKDEPQIIGDKNPVYSYNFKHIFPVFPKAKYIHLTRDYRDQIVSMKKMDFEMSHPALVAYRWKLSVKEVDEFRIKFPDQFYCLKYEDLVSEPEKKINEICNFLGIRYAKEMLDFHDVNNVGAFLPETAMKKFHSSLLNPVTTSKVNIWESKLTNQEVRKADLVVGGSAEIAGYPRRYKGFNFWVFLSVIPFVLYGWLWGMSRKASRLLPYEMNMYLRRLSPTFPRLYWKLKNKKNNLDQA